MTVVLDVNSEVCCLPTISPLPFFPFFPIPFFFPFSPYPFPSLRSLNQNFPFNAHQHKTSVYNAPSCYNLCFAHRLVSMVKLFDGSKIIVVLNKHRLVLRRRKGRRYRRTTVRILTPWSYICKNLRKSLNGTNLMKTKSVDCYP